VMSLLFVIFGVVIITTWIVIKDEGRTGRKFRPVQSENEKNE
jgi:hypothetical protein